MGEVIKGTGFKYLDFFKDIKAINDAGKGPEILYPQISKYRPLNSAGVGLFAHFLDISDEMWVLFTERYITRIWCKAPLDARSTPGHISAVAQTHRVTLAHLLLTASQLAEAASFSRPPFAPALHALPLCAPGVYEMAVWLRQMKKHPKKKIKLIPLNLNSTLFRIFPFLQLIVGIMAGLAGTFGNCT